MIYVKTPIVGWSKDTSKARYGKDAGSKILMDIGVFVALFDGDDGCHVKSMACIRVTMVF